MKKKWYLKGILMLTVILLVFSGLKTYKSIAKQNSRITVYLAGDSTVANYPSNRAPRAGWGQMLPQMFDEQIIVKNEAVPGRSTKSFINEGRLRSILKKIHKGDYLLIQFGHNDEKSYDSSRYTDPATSYQRYLKEYIDGARNKGAIPILVTPVERRNFSTDGKALSTHGQYPDAMKVVGRKENVPVIDLTSKSMALYQQLGPEKTKEFFLFLEAGEHPNYPGGVQDPIHFQEKGAREIAKLIAEGIAGLNLPLQKHILKNGGY
ncbi:rhamnogalacturonan acetylesterase [Neobacillus bataviensis]|uniref:rhamnogalacturonan acetylesterase n=1 Tax=Neobacillus bataviensis TaxID=220685 RepID=UPI001CC1BA62|nr:rhamnogalacturonan acetylesterase [Neobacillus bataviensis]